MAILMIDPLTAGFAVVFIIATSAGTTFLITKKISKTQGAWKKLRSRFREVRREVSSLKKDNADLVVTVEKVLLEAQRVSSELSTERATRDSSLRAERAEIRLEAIKSVNVTRELLCKELPRSWNARNYALAYRETVSVLGVARPELVIGKFESRIDPERILAVLGSGVKLIRLAAGDPRP